MNHTPTQSCKEQSSKQSVPMPVPVYVCLCVVMCVCVLCFGRQEGCGNYLGYGKLSYKQVRTPSSINPATNSFDQFVVSIQFKSLPQASVFVSVCARVQCFSTVN